MMVQPGRSPRLDPIMAPFPRIFSDNPGRDAACKTILHQLAAGDVVAPVAAGWLRVDVPAPKPALRPRRYWYPAGDPEPSWQEMAGGRRAQVMLAAEMRTGSIHTYRDEPVGGRPQGHPQAVDRDPFTGEPYPDPATPAHGKPEHLVWNASPHPMAPRWWGGSWQIMPGMFVELSAGEYDDLAARGLLDRVGLDVRRHVDCAAPQRPCDCGAL
jgi:hypothetical protein